MSATELLTPLPVSAFSAVSNCGAGVDSLYDGLISGITALQPLQLFETEFAVYAGEVASELLPELAPERQAYASRNAQLALAALNVETDKIRENIERLKQRYGSARIGVIIGTSTSAIYETELAYTSLANTGSKPPAYHFSTQHAWVSTARFLKEELGLRGPCYGISTACSSASKAIAAAQRLIASGVCDAVLAGGVDSICKMTVHGFNSLELVSEKACTPLDQNRSGISLGEGAGLLILERPNDCNSDCLQLLGCGESSDAYHMTAPHPQGRGAQLAMAMALQRSGLSANQIDYVNLHATGTPKNDASEMIAVNAVFGDNVSCSGTKGLTGHTLGAAGAIEAVISLLSLERQFLPGTCGLIEPDQAFCCDILRESKQDVRLDHVMSNNYGFGGNNASLIFGYLHAR